VYVALELLLTVEDVDLEVEFDEGVLTVVFLLIVVLPDCVLGE
tara:strand:- start:238 stop:366 length:129 start_codon:yes stop_codon:yes gene_type:complete